MKYVVEMGSICIICIPSFMKIGSGIQGLIAEGNSQIHRQHGDRISLPLFLNEESRLE
jgi:hypothetical protein